MSRLGRIGLVLGSAIAPERIRPLAARAEDVGLDELWFSEDCFFTGGISGATAALGATSQLGIGLGVVSAVLRQPALLAMEVATMAGAFPGRLTVGIGLGVPDWLRQLDVMPASPRTAVRECVTSLRALLAGERLEASGDYFAFHDVALAHPPAATVPLHLGVVGRRMLQLSGEIADGTVVSVCAGPRYVAWARQQISAGRAAIGESGHHVVTVFALYAVDRDREVATRQVRGPLAFYLSADQDNDLTRVQELQGQVVELLARAGQQGLAAEMPSSWCSELAVSGTPEDCAEQIRALYAAGADSVALLPVGEGQALEQVVSVTAREVVPLLADHGGAR